MCHKLLCNKTKYFRLQLIRLPNHPVNAGHLLVILIFTFLSSLVHGILIFVRQGFPMNFFRNMMDYLESLLSKFPF